MCMNKEIAQRIYDSGKEPTIAKLIELDSKVDELTARIVSHHSCTRYHESGNIQNAA